ncbi:hypothetical protein ACWDV4_05680 [Micromonospora sp. NPDC003197]
MQSELVDEIVAAYAAGHPVSAIEARYGIPHWEIERILVESLAHEPDRGTVAPPLAGTPSPGAPVVAPNHPPASTFAPSGTMPALPAAPVVRAPAPIIGAVVLIALAAVGRIVNVPSALLPLDVFATLPTVVMIAIAIVMIAIIIVVYGLVGFGVWRGYQWAQWLAVLGGGATVVAGYLMLNDAAPVTGLLLLAEGGALVSLVLVPESVRVWFANR